MDIKHFSVKWKKNTYVLEQLNGSTKYQLSDSSAATEISLSYDVGSGSEITPCNKVYKQLVVYRFSRNDMTPITTLRT